MKKTNIEEDEQIDKKRRLYSRKPGGSPRYRKTSCGIVSPDQNLKYVPTARLGPSHPRKLFLEGTYEGAHEEVIGL